MEIRSTIANPRTRPDMPTRQTSATAAIITTRARTAAVDVGKRIATRRTALGLSQNQLARRAGLTARRVRRIERATTQVTLADLASIAGALGVPPAILAGWESSNGRLTRTPTPATTTPTTPTSALTTGTAR